MPVAIGIVNEKAADDKALNITRAEAKIRMNAIITGILIRNPIHSLKPSKTNPCNFSFMMAAPETLRIA
ncbi:MAG: hypothetical protein NTX61_06860 [Bacteroidetes bacterium]|nr:hypothetical protein [Bacteroidota bacterium]